MAEVRKLSKRGNRLNFGARRKKAEGEKASSNRDKKAAQLVSVRQHNGSTSTIQFAQEPKRAASRTHALFCSSSRSLRGCGCSLSIAKGTPADCFGLVYAMEGTLASGAAGAVGGAGEKVGPILKIVRTAQSAEQQLSAMREVKNSLVGNEEAKHAALGLYVVEDILTFLDDAAGSSSDRHYELSLLHGIGLLGILNSPPLPRGLAEIYLAPSASRVVEHIVRALEIGSFSTSTSAIDGKSSGSSSGERLTATALRAISSLCACFVPLTTTTTTTCFVDAAEAAATATPTPTPTPTAMAVATAAAKEEREKSLAVLVKASGMILNAVVATTTSANIARGRGRSSQSSRCWSASLTTLGLKALAAITKVDDLARGLVRAVLSTEAVLLAPIV